MHCIAGWNAEGSGAGVTPLCGVGSLLPEVQARAPDPAPNEARGLLPLSMVLGHHPTVATAKIHLGRGRSQRHVGGGGDQTDPHVVKLGNGNVGDLRDRQSRREGEGKKLKAKG